MGDSGSFSYQEAFSRNIGWVTEWEQRLLRGKRVAIAGMGGVGGRHLLTLTRLGIGHFRITDFDQFELANFNRQDGSSTRTIGRPKLDVVAEMALDINPELEIVRFSEGLTHENMDRFLEGVDLFIDGLDFFVLELRREVFARCYARGIPAITAGPIGLGTACIVFLPGKMSFEQYFRLEGLPPEEQALHFLVGLTPRAFQRGALVDPFRVNLAARRGPSTVIACQLCAGVAAAETFKILLGRGKVRAAPRYHQFDPYRGKWAVGWLPGGNLNPLQRLRKAVARLGMGRLSRNPPPDAAPGRDTPILEQIVGLARWAPSGDNLQPWRFEILSETPGSEALRLHVIRPEPPDVYDYNDGEPTLFSVGTLLESLRLAATRFGRGTRWSWREDEGRASVQVSFSIDEAVVADPLAAELTARSVDRRRFRTTELTVAQKESLSAAIRPDFEVTWFETSRDRWEVSRLNAAATDIRLRIPEAFSVHQRVIDWERDFSPDKVPVRAVGMALPSVAMMSVMMRDWGRMDAANRFLGATLLARLELDLLPGMACAAHFAISPIAGKLASMHDPEMLLQAGCVLQRFWLTATRLGLVLQPGLAPLCFASYGRRGFAFTKDARVQVKAERLATQLDAFTRARCPAPPLLLGRIGVPAGRRIAARSVRHPLEVLIQRSATVV